MTQWRIAARNKRKAIERAQPFRGQEGGGFAHLGVAIKGKQDRMGCVTHCPIEVMERGDHRGPGATACGKMFEHLALVAQVEVIGRLIDQIDARLLCQ